MLVQPITTLRSCIHRLHTIYQQKRTETKAWDLPRDLYDRRKGFKMFVIPTRGPSPVMNITDENSNDVTKMVLPYMGPNYNWHGISITPKNLEYEQLSFQLSNGSNYTYNSTDSMA